MKSFAMEVMHLLVTLSLLVLCTDSYPQGPPVNDHPEICMSMMPDHGAVPQTTGSPYKIKVGNTCYNSGQDVEVWIMAKDGEDVEIEGFFIQARSAVHMSNSTIFGNFSCEDEEEKHIGGYNCFGQENSAYGHKGDEVDAKQVGFTWTAPHHTMDDLVFKATVVKKKVEFWTMITSDVMTYNASCIQPISAAPPPMLTSLVPTALLCACALLWHRYF